MPKSESCLERSERLGGSMKDKKDNHGNNLQLVLRSSSYLGVRSRVGKRPTDVNRPESDNLGD